MCVYVLHELIFEVWTQLDVSIPLELQQAENESGMQLKNKKAKAI
jgi:hypothetical protein